jgi:hypothetical protein
MAFFCIETDSHILAMTDAVKDEKQLCLMVDHTNFLNGLRKEVIVQFPIPFANPHETAEGAEQL